MKKIRKLNIYLEKRASRILVGDLTKDGPNYIFEYNKEYAYSKNAIPIGPDLPLKKRTYKSIKLFSSFKDRIPSRENPAKEYCRKFNISEDEDNELILLSTIGQKGPSSFIFEASIESEYENVNYLFFRKELGISIRDFSHAFDIPLSTLQSIEKNKFLGKEALKRIEIYDMFPEVAKFEVQKNKSLIHGDKFRRIEIFLENKIQYKLNRGLTQFKINT